MTWTHPKFENHTYVTKKSFETTPFVWKGRLYTLENFFRSRNDFPDKPVQYKMHEDGCYIRDVETDTRLCYPWLNHYFSTVNVFNDKLVLVGGDYGWNRPWWNIKRMQMMTSDDLTTWSRPVTIFEANERENLFNNCIVFDGEKYVLLYETDDPALRSATFNESGAKGAAISSVRTNFAGWIFTFRFAVSKDLVNWEKLPEEYVYGIGKYVGGPGLYYQDGYYYCLYLAETFGKSGFWDTRITRSKNLKDWEDAPEGRSFVYPDTSHVTNPELAPDIHEVNASDVELVEFNGQVHIWWCGGNQGIVGDIQHAVYNGTLKQLLEAFFE